VALYNRDGIPYLKRFNAVLVIPLLAAAQPLPPGRGRDVVQRVCTKCHAATVFETQRHTRREWADIVREMQNAGAKASKTEFRAIVEYLAKTFPKR
jgi:hypothetical protein